MAFGSQGNKGERGTHYVDETIREEKNWLGKFVLLARKLIREISVLQDLCRFTDDQDFYPELTVHLNFISTDR